MANSGQFVSLVQNNLTSRKCHLFLVEYGAFHWLESSDIAQASALAWSPSLDSYG
jgi:hypothetical protein